MSDLGRRRSRSRILTAMVCSLACALGAERSVADDPQNLIRPLQEDAELTDVAFVDAEHGWAVGDWGTIWQTTDGGAHWGLQTSGVGCRLESVQFTDANNGWAAGSMNHPYSQTTHGVLLRTHDGGRTWQRDNNLMLPALKRIKFFNAGRGWALGQPSHLFGTGLFSTDDGGRSWTPQCGTSVASWSFGDFADAATGVVASRSGVLGAVRQGTIDEHASPGGLRNVRSVKFSGPKSGWLVGDGGLVLSTTDLGQNWQPPASDPVQVVGTDFDCQALAVRGSKCWIAGSPGTRVLHSDDDGRTWQAFATGQNAPLTALAFVDDQHGWAVGELGVILRTSDGGHSWQRQRSTAKRAALLAFFSEPEKVPLELIARVSGNEGFLSAICFLNRLDVETHTQSADSLAERGHAAMAALGASSAKTAWAFPIRQPGVAVSADQLVATWNRIHNGQGVERLEAYLVREIRCWRPEVIVTHATSPRGDDLLGHTINQIVLLAAEQAADPQQFPEQITQLGLEPWQARKVLGALPDGQLGTMNLTSSQLAPRLGCSLADAADTARALLFDSYTPAPATIGFQLLVDHIPQGAGAQDIMSGVTLYPGGEARRLLGDAGDSTNDLMRRVAQKHRSLQAILVHLGKRGQDTQRVLGQIAELTRDLDARSGGELLFQLAQHYQRSGRWDLAAETFELLVNRYPDHLLAEPAYVWLLQCATSSEVAWQMQRRHETGTPGPEQPANQAFGTLAQLKPDVNQLAARNAAPPKSGSINHEQRAVLVGRFIEQRYMASFCEPSVQFPLAVALNASGLERQAEKIVQIFSRARPHDVWWACAAGEEWLKNPQGEPPKNLCRAAPCLAKPRLDGKLDDAVWQQAVAVELHSTQHDDGDWPAVALLAHDNEFLYLAVNCRRSANAPDSSTPARTPGPRPRDPDLSASDRVEVYLDIDRDWVTAYRLVVDQRGWATEDCWGDPTWNPSWFIATDQQAASWTVEAAIPLAELTNEPPKSKDAWAIGLQRIVPGVGFQSWTTPAAVKACPEGFGYLLFE